MTNRYLEKIAQMRCGVEKRASLAALLGFHMAQNLGAKLALKTPKAAQVVADAVRQGFVHGKHYETPLGVKALAGIAGREFLEVPHLANKAAIGFHDALNAKGHVMSKSDHLAMRMLTQGRFQDLEKLHRRTGGATKAIVQHATDYAKNFEAVGPAIGKAVANGSAKPVSDLFKKEKGIMGRLSSKDHPLLNNISYNVTRGKEVPVRTSRLHKVIEPGMTAALATVEPAGAGLNAFKQVLTSDRAQKVPVVKRVGDWFNKAFINTAETSANAGARETGGGLVQKSLDFARSKGKIPEGVKDTYSRVANAGKGLILNGLAGELDRTSHALGRAAGQTARNVVGA